MTAGAAHAKVNLALVVGPLRPDGKHDVATVLQRVDLADTISVEPSPELRVTGFEEDTLVSRALQALAEAARVEPAWHVSIDKRIPVAAGLAGGSSDAATALRLANETLDRPVPLERLSRLAARLGADVPFFLAPGPQLGSGDGTELEPVDLPLGYHVVIVLPDGAIKESTASVYEAFDRRRGGDRFAARRRRLVDALGAVRQPKDLSDFPPNDLASSPLAADLERRGAFRADVSGAGPALYGLFEHEHEADAAAEELRALGATWVCRPCRGTVGPR